MGNIPHTINAIRSGDFNMAMGSIESIPQSIAPGATTSQEGFHAVQHSASLDTSPGAEPFPWEMIGLGLEEPLPSQEVINEL